MSLARNLIVFTENQREKTKLILMTYVTYIWSSIRRGEIAETRKACENVAIKNKLTPYEARLMLSRMLNKISVPEVPPLGKLYAYFSTAIHIIFIIQTILNNYVQSRPNLKSYRRFLDCYGAKLIIQDDLNPKLVLLLASIFHLIWRSLVMFFGNVLNLQTIPFLLADNKIVSDLSRSVREETSLAPSVEGHPLFHTMFFEHQINENKTIYVLRSNRTQRTKERLLVGIEQDFSVCIMWMCSALLFFIPVGLRSIVMGKIFLGCEPMNSLIGEIIRYVPSFVVSFVIGFDCLIALFVPICLLKIFVKDLRSYWQSIEAELNKLLESYQKVPSGANDTYYQPYFIAQSSITNKDELKFSLISWPGKKQLEVKILQNQAREFFNQLRLANNFISPMLSFILVIWYLNNCILTFVDLEVVPLLLKTIQAVGMMAIIQCWPVIILTQEVRSGYQLISSIMCLERDERTKRDWSTILEYYTRKPRRYGFTILSRELFSLSTIFRYAAITMSAPLITDTYFHR